MKTIRIDNDVFGMLQKKAKAFEDTPNSVLRRVLGLDRSKKQRNGRPRAPRGEKTPQEAYRQPILKALYGAGGSAKVADVLDRVQKGMDGKLNDVDRQMLSTGTVRWRNTAQWARNELVQDGLLKKSSPRGVWELTQKGVAAAEAHVG